MKSLPKPLSWLPMFLISVFLAMTALSAISPGTPARAATLDQLIKMPESTPGGLTVTWYSAKRFQGSSSIDSLFNVVSRSPLDRAASDTAYDSFDRSVCLGTEPLSDLSFDMSNWVEADGSPPSPTVHDTYTWGEVTGYLKMPTWCVLYVNCYPEPITRRDVYFEVSGYKFGEWRDKFIGGGLSDGFKMSRVYGKDEFVPFHMYIGRSNIQDRSEKVWLSFTTSIGGLNPIIYSKLSLKDIRQFLQFNPGDFTLTLVPIPNFPVEEFEYGIVAPGGDVGTAKGFQPLQLGVNYLTPDSGTIVIRDKMLKTYYISVGEASLSAPRGLAVTKRTSSTASLSWQPPLQEVPQGYVIPYEIYRKPVEGKHLFSFNHTLSVEEPSKVGTTTALTFTDQGLGYDSTYEYFVKAQYPTGFSYPSETARSDSVGMEGLPSIPEGLRFDLVSQTPKADLKLSWTASTSPVGIKGYIIYRKITRVSTPSTQNPDGSYTLSGDVSFSVPVEIARTPDLSYIDRGLKLTDICEYSVQAVDKNGFPSYISSPLDASFERFIPPTKPEGLRVGGVLRQGDKVEYDFPREPGSGNVLMGPQREVALRWEPSTDNVGVVGYNIYRAQYDSLGIAAVNIDMGDTSSSGVPVAFIGGAAGSSISFYGGGNSAVAIAPVASGAPDQGSLVGSTGETLFIDKGLEFGKVYVYYVEAWDADGNTATSYVSVSTRKFSLADLAISDGSQHLNPEPAFAYYQTQYTLNVANAVKSISLTPKKTDPQAKVVVNGIEAAGDGGIPVVLDPGDNTVRIEVFPPGGQLPIIKLETVRYTLTVNRANLDTLPALTLPGSGTVLDEGSTYKAAGRIDIPDDQAWTGTIDYGDGSGGKPLQLNADGSFILEHKYLDNGQYKISVSFRYKDLGLVKDSLELNVQNVAPSLTGVKDEYATKEGAPLTIEGSIVDPGQDTWTVAGDYGSEWGPTRGTVDADKTFTLQVYFNDQKPEYDMVLKITDDDGGVFSKDIKIKVENVAPTVQAGKAAMIQRGTAFTGAGSFTDPGVDQWRVTVDFGDGSGQQELTLKSDKTFDLNHTYLKTGIFTVTVRVEDQDGGAGSASFQVKVKDYLFTLEAGADASLQEGEKLTRDIPVRGRPDKIKSITVDYGDGTGEGPVAWSTHPGAQSGSLKSPNPLLIAVGRAESMSTGAAEAGWLPLQHTYTDNGTYTVKTKIVDAEGDSYEDSFRVEVANVPPTVQLEHIGNMYPGNTFTCRGSFTDPGADTWTVEIDFKDGSEPGKINVDSDKNFSFSHSYSTSGNYSIEAVVRDDDGGIGRGNQQTTVLFPSKAGGGSISHDATLHSLAGLPNLKQDDDLHGYMDDGFIPDCLQYTCTGAFMLTYITVTADPGAAITYTIDGGAVQDLPQNTPTGINLDVGSTLTITVTTEDGITTSEYSFSHI